MDKTSQKPSEAGSGSDKMYEGFGYDITMSELDKQFYEGLNREIDVDYYPFLKQYDLDPLLLEQKTGGDEDVIQTLKYMDAITGSIEENDITLIQGGTGLGKTVGMAYAAKQLGRKTIINVPKREIATGVANYINEDFGQKRFPGQAPGKGVGYKIRGSSSASNDTDVVYVTDGIGINMVTDLIEKNQLNNKVIVIDEFHERNQNMDILLLSLMRARAQGHNFKLVIMSATIDTKKLLDYFQAKFAAEDKELRDHDPKVGLLQFPSLRKHEVYIKNGDPSQEIPTLIDQISKMVDPNNPNKQYTEKCLVFRQGKKDIMRTIATINMLLASKGLSAMVEVVSMVGSMTRDELNQSKKKSGKIKIIVGTNMLGSGVTLDNLQWVSSNGIVKRKIVQNDFDQLVEEIVSQDEILQYLGRGGRTCPTMAFFPFLEKLITKYPKNDPRSKVRTFKLEHHEKFALPELKRIKPSSTLFTLINNNLAEHRRELLDAPNEQDMIAAEEELQLLGLIDKSNHITELGKVVGSLGMDYRIAISLLESMKYGKEEDMIALLACQVIGLKTKRAADGSGTRFPEELYSERSEALTQFNVYKSIIKKTRDIELAITDIIETMANLKQGSIVSKDEQEYKERMYSLSIRLGKQRKLLSRVLEKHNVGYMQWESVRQTYQMYRRSLRNIDRAKITRKDIPDGFQIEDVLLTCLFKGNLDKIRINSTNRKGEEHQNAPWEKKTGPIKIGDGVTYNDEKKGDTHRQLSNVSLLELKHLLGAYPEHLVVDQASAEYIFDYGEQKVKREMRRLFLGIFMDRITEEVSAEDKSVMTFCQKLHIYGSHSLQFSDDAKSKGIEEIMKSISSKNKETIKQFNSLCDRMNQHEKCVVTDTFIQLFYFEIIRSRGIYSTKQFEEFLVTHPELLVFDDISRLIPNYANIMKKYPDSILISGKEYSAKYRRENNYSSNYTDRYVVTLNGFVGEDISDVNTATLQGLFPDKKVEIVYKETDESSHEVIADIDVWKQQKLERKINAIRKTYLEGEKYSDKFSFSEELVATDWSVSELIISEDPSVTGYRTVAVDGDMYYYHTMKTKEEAERSMQLVKDRLDSWQQEQKVKKQHMQEIPELKSDLEFYKLYYDGSEEAKLDQDTYNWEYLIAYISSRIESFEESFYSGHVNDAKRALKRLYNKYEALERNNVRIEYLEVDTMLKACGNYKITESYKVLESKWSECVSTFERNYANEDVTIDDLKGYIAEMKKVMPIIKSECEGTINGMQIVYTREKQKYDNLMARLLTMETKNPDRFTNDRALKALLRKMFDPVTVGRRGGGTGRRRSDADVYYQSQSFGNVIHFPLITSEEMSKILLDEVANRLSELEEIVSRYEEDKDQNTSHADTQAQTLDTNDAFSQLKGIFGN